MNRIIHGDCLFVMNHDIAPESVDLIYLDPPFFTGKVQKGTTKKATEWMPGAMEISYDDSRKFWGDSEKVKDMRKKAPTWLIDIGESRPDFASYLYYMMERLQACKKVLKPTGSLYLHCDPTASHYLKLLLDAVFGAINFRNEIVWCYETSGKSKRYFNQKHDTIFLYSKTCQYLFNEQREITTKNIGRYNKTDDNGDKYYMRSGKYKVSWHGTKPINDFWVDLPALTNNAKERQGYPTQKPIALLERIITASSNEGDTVLDPFCGCGTTIAAAKELKRNWIGIDISKQAYDMSKDRLL